MSILKLNQFWDSGVFNKFKSQDTETSKLQSKPVITSIYNELG